MSKKPSLPSEGATQRGKAAPQLSLTEVQQAFVATVQKCYPPILTLAEAAEITRLKSSTLKRKVSEGQFKGCVRRGKPLLFWRDRFVQAVMIFER